uniref:Uncharacterized protein n=1 Tax=viral metagenome TaxID=1070528 RepID=A0A6C0DT39_9ZZZZ
MAKSHARKNNFFRKSLKNIRTTSEKVLPKVEDGLESVGKLVTNVAITGAPIVEKGVTNTFNILKKTSRYAVTGVKKSMAKRHKKRHHKTRRHKRRHH